MKGMDRLKKAVMTPKSTKIAKEHNISKAAARCGSVAASLKENKKGGKKSK